MFLESIKQAGWEFSQCLLILQPVPGVPESATLLLTSSVIAGKEELAEEPSCRVSPQSGSFTAQEPSPGTSTHSGVDEEGGLRGFHGGLESWRRINGEAWSQVDYRVDLPTQLHARQKWNRICGFDYCLFY